MESEGRARKERGQLNGKEEIQGQFLVGLVRKRMEIRKLR